MTRYDAFILGMTYAIKVIDKKRRGKTSNYVFAVKQELTTLKLRKENEKTKCKAA